MRKSKDYAENIADIVNGANTALIISSMGLPSEYYEKSEVVEAIEKAIGERVSVHILTGLETKSNPPYLDRVTKYVLQYGPNVNFVIGVSKSNWLNRIFTPHKFDFLIYPEEGSFYERADRRKDDPLSSHYLLEKFMQVVEKLKPKSQIDPELYSIHIPDRYRMFPELTI